MEPDKSQPLGSPKPDNSNGPTTWIQGGHMVGMPPTLIHPTSSNDIDTGNPTDLGPSDIELASRTAAADRLGVAGDDESKAGALAASNEPKNVDAPMLDAPAVPSGFAPTPPMLTSTEPTAPAAPFAPTIPTAPGLPGAVPQAPSVPLAPSTPGSPVTMPLPGTASGKKKKLLLFGGVGLATLLLAGGAVFGLYLPNTPGSVWKTGLNRSGTALESVIQSGTTDDKLKAFSTASAKGSVDVHFGNEAYSGTFDIASDKTSSDGGLSVTFNDGSGKKTVSLDGLSKIPAGKTYPDVYLQFSGFKDLGLDGFVPGISAYDGKWIWISSDYLQQMSDSYAEMFGTSLNDSRSEDLTAQDGAEVVRAIAGVTKDYVFTTDADKALLVQKSFVGKEQVDGLTAYHYKVGVNSDHSKLYCEAVGNAVIATKAYKKITGSTASQITDAKKSWAEECKNSEPADNTDPFDLWIDGKYKLVYKARFTTKDEPGTYSEFGQIYKGGDKISLFWTSHSDKSKYDGKSTLDIDMKTFNTKGALTMKSTSGDYKFDVKATLEATVSNEPVKITPPTNPVPIEDFLKKMGWGDSLVYDTVGGVQLRAQDTERMTDINALDSHIEAAYAFSGVYPTLAQLNDANWRKDNMRGLDPEALSPPNSTNEQLASKPSATQYAYVPSSCAADGCQAFSLSALLSDGTTFEKSSF